MAIQIKKDCFYLRTKRTSYIFALKNGIPAHLYYGEVLPCEDDLRFLISDQFRSFQPEYKERNDGCTLDSVWLEYSFFDSGDFHSPSMLLQSEKGNYLSDFRCVGYKIIKGRPTLQGLPCGRFDETVETLELTMQCGNVFVKLYYVVYPNIDVICRYAVVENRGKETLTIRKISSATLDLQGDNYKVLTVQGRVARERTRRVCNVPFGKYSVSSRVGASSHSASPFLMLAEGHATENDGGVYALNLVYSGNFLAETDYDDLKRLRASIGVNSEDFSYTLCQGECFYSPEAILTYSAQGYNGASIALADYIRGYIMPEKFAFASRPVVINTWESFFFELNEKKLADFAVRAKQAGVDTLVIDDGWFSSRRADNSGLGDWTVSPEIFPSGLDVFAEKVNKIGLNLGIWVEPEMVNPDSELFQNHPDWALGTVNVQSRNQLVLDLTNPTVVEYLYECFERLFSNINITYVKWDFNRYICPFLSSYTKNSAEIAHKYMLGVYSLLDRLTRRFPDILLETCAGGGGRFDAGMLRYSPQIWTSDNTCPFERAYIQAGASYAYPVSAMSCHVTASPNGGTQLLTTMDFRFGIAVNGALGYELDLFKLNDNELAEIKEQIGRYRKMEKLMLEGDFYRLVTPFDNEKYYAFAFVAKDKETAMVSFNTLVGAVNNEEYILKIYGLDDDKTYRIGDIRVSGKACRLAGLRMPRAKQSGENYTFMLYAEN